MANHAVIKQAQTTAGEGIVNWLELSRPADGDTDYSYDTGAGTGILIPEGAIINRSSLLIKEAYTAFEVAGFVLTLIALDGDPINLIDVYDKENVGTPLVSEEHVILTEPMYASLAVIAQGGLLISGPLSTPYGECSATVSWYNRYGEGLSHVEGGLSTE